MKSERDEADRINEHCLFFMPIQEITPAIQDGIKVLIAFRLMQSSRAKAKWAVAVLITVHCRGE